MSTTPSTLPSISSILLAELGQHLRVVAEDLHFDRRRVAFEVAEHVLEQLHELDVEPGRRVVQLVAEIAR